MCRSSIFSPLEEKVLVAANGSPGTANLWDISDPNWKQTMTTPSQAGAVLDFVPCKVNNNYLLSMISGGAIGVYGMN
jgi:WD40 repeat protein